MQLPRENKIYENLSLKIVNFKKLLEELRERKTTGYLEISFRENSDLLFLNHGEVLRAAKFSDGRKTLLSKKVMIENFRAVNGVLNVYEISQELFNILLAVLESKPLYQNLSGKFVNLKNLLVELEEKKHSGVVEISSKKEKGYLLLEDGVPIDGFHYNNKLTTGESALDLIFSITNEKTIINVYETKKKTEVRDFNLKTIFSRRESSYKLTDPKTQDFQVLIDKFGEFGVELIEYIDGRSTLSQILEKLESAGEMRRVKPILIYYLENGYIERD
ncbi:MAG: hypothetical protein ACE5HW_04340 [Candidatus Methanofastidiosia archaeon]